MRNVILVGEYQLQCVGAGRQLHGGLRLAATEMDVVFVCGDVVGDLVGAVLALTQRRAIDEQVMVAGFSLSMPAEATPMPDRPKTTLAGPLTVSPFFRLMK